MSAYLAQPPRDEITAIKASISLAQQFKNYKRVAYLEALLYAATLKAARRLGA